MQTQPLSQDVIAAGFTQPVHDSQRIFRSVLEAMSRPGTIVPLYSLPADNTQMLPAQASVALALADLETTLWLDDTLNTEVNRRYLRFHCGCPLTKDPAKATFAFIGQGDRLPELDQFSIGTAEYPDRSITLVIRVDSLSNQNGRHLNGPGVNGKKRLAPQGLDPVFWKRFAENQILFPLGFDTIFVSSDSLACLPRTTHAKEA